MNDTRTIAKIDQANVLVMFALGLIGAVTLSWNVAVGLVVGCAVMAVDFYILRKLLMRMLFGEKGSPWVAVGLLVFKFVGLFGLVALCLFFIPMNLLAFALGATAAVVTAAGVAFALQPKTSKG